MTKPGKTSSGSWIWGFRSTMNGSSHLSLMVLSVSPSPTTYISSQWRSSSDVPRKASPEIAAAESQESEEELALSLTEASRIRTSSTAAQYHDATSATTVAEDRDDDDLLVVLDV